MILISSTGIFAIIAIVLWIVGMPVMYPRFIEQYLIDRVTKRHLILSNSFFFSYLLGGILLLIFGHTVSGIVIISILVVAYGLMKSLLYNSFNLVLDFLYDPEKYIFFYFLTGGILFYGIYEFYANDYVKGIILCWMVILNIVSTIILFIAADRKESPTYVNEITENKIQEWDITSTFSELNLDLLGDLNFNLDEIHYAIKSFLKIEYSEITPKQLTDKEKADYVLGIKEYLSNDKVKITEKDRKVLNLIINYINELTKWGKQAEDWTKTLNNLGEKSPKQIETSKKQVKKIIKDIKKDKKTPGSKKAESKPIHSTPPEN